MSVSNLSVIFKRCSKSSQCGYIRTVTIPRFYPWSDELCYGFHDDPTSNWIPVDWVVSVDTVENSSAEILRGGGIAAKSILGMSAWFLPENFEQIEGDNPWF